MFGSKKRAQQYEQDSRDREIRDLKYTIEQTRGYITKSESALAEARAQGDKSREAACQRVLNTWKNGLAHDLTRLNKLR